MAWGSVWLVGLILSSLVISETQKEGTEKMGHHQKVSNEKSFILENQLLLISIKFTPKTSHSCPKNGTFLGFPGLEFKESNEFLNRPPKKNSDLEILKNLCDRTKNCP